MTLGTVPLDAHILSDRFSHPIFGDDKINNEPFRELLCRSKRFVNMKGTYLTCRYVDDLGGFGSYFSLSLIACFHPTLLLLLSWFLLYFAGSELDLLLVVIG